MIQFGLSPCPNDTYIFFKFIQNKEIDPIFLDVEELNQLALLEKIPLIKVSCATAVQLKNYHILSSGGAMGFGCGPIIVSNFKYLEKDISLKNKIENWEIFIPGRHTTANFLFSTYCKENQIVLKNNINYIRYDKIIPELLKLKQKNIPSLGILIHEERFTYSNFNLFLEIDLGSWWESFTKLPIPLGCIVIHKSIFEQKNKIQKEIQESIFYSQKHFEEVLPFIKEKAQTLSEEAIKEHIKLYVNEFSIELGKKGWEALEKLKKFINSDI